MTGTHAMLASAQKSPSTTLEIEPCPVKENLQGRASCWLSIKRSAFDELVKSVILHSVCSTALRDFIALQIVL